MHPRRDTQLRELASRQHGRVAWWQLKTLAWTRDEVRWARKRGRLTEITEGVFAVGHRAPSVLGDWSAAVLAAGPQGGTLPARAAAAAHGPLPPPPLIDVISPPHQRARWRVRFHRHSLDEDHVTHIHGLRVTTIPQLLIDMAAQRQSIVIPL